MSQSTATFLLKRKKELLPETALPQSEPVTTPDSELLKMMGRNGFFNALPKHAGSQRKSVKWHIS